MKNLGMYCKAILLPAILFSSFTLAGCGDAYKGSRYGSPNDQVSIEFKSGGKAHFKVFSEAIDGDYTVEGDKVTFDTRGPQGKVHQGRRWNAFQQIEWISRSQDHQADQERIVNRTRTPPVASRPRVHWRVPRALLSAPGVRGTSGPSRSDKRLLGQSPQPVALPGRSDRRRPR